MVTTCGMLHPLLYLLENPLLSKFDPLGTAIQLVNLLLLVSWLVLSMAALIGLRRRRLEPGIQILWTILVILVPILGPLAFFVVAPGRKET